MTHKPEWEEQIRDWWYSVQDDCSAMMHSLPEAKRVELEHIFSQEIQRAKERTLDDVLTILREPTPVPHDWYISEVQSLKSLASPDSNKTSEKTT